MDLVTPDGAGASFRVRLNDGSLAVDEREYPLPGEAHAGWLDIFEALARDFGLRAPLSREAPPVDVGAPALEPVLTEPLSASMPYGYGDPCVVRVGEGDYRLLATSNDAPNAFPILTSSDLKAWRHLGFVFPEGSAPPWALTGAGVADFWAPELHRVGDEWWVCFTARTHDRTLAIGLARGASPDGPFTPDAAPLIGGGVIDAHILVDAAGAPWLIWKQDDNDRWPRALMALLESRPALVPELFEGKDARTAAFLLTLWPWARSMEPMRQFFVLQTLVEAVGEDLDAFAGRIESLPEAQDILKALRTRIFAQRLSSDGRRLEGEAKVILHNDLPWEGHLIEGVWVTQEGGRYYLVYSGNDFSTARYGIGLAVAEAPDGPYRKGAEAFLRSTPQWWGPGHPSVTTDLDGRRRMFLHGFRPGEAAYGAFRALLTTPVRFEDGEVRL
ncbi:MAG TPA: glycoside hydrolase family 43 protein [Caulobacteraceae bacterium]|nr:glycoside hydrolase family 43 protein [Caulobacteraceae bacterium]